MKVIDSIKQTEDKLNKAKLSTELSQNQKKKLIDELNFRLHFLNWLEIENIQEVEEEFQYNPCRKYRFDFYFPNQKIGIDLHGLYHFSYHSAIKNDLEKIIDAQKQGYKYFIFSTNMKNYELILELLKKIK